GRTRACRAGAGVGCSTRRSVVLRCRSADLSSRADRCTLRVPARLHGHLRGGPPDTTGRTLDRYRACSTRGTVHHRWTPVPDYEPSAKRAPRGAHLSTGSCRVLL